MPCAPPRRSGARSYRRLCGAGLSHTFVDLGMSPLCESYLALEELDAMEPYFPLHALVCGNCFLVQLKEYVSPESIFREYAYFSSYSTTWVAHAKAYCERIATRLGLGPDSLVVELASNDGYLLKNYVEAGIPVLGIDPAAGPVRAAQAAGVPTMHAFFTKDLAAELASQSGSSRNKRTFSSSRPSTPLIAVIALAMSAASANGTKIPARGAMRARSNYRAST